MIIFPNTLPVLLTQALWKTLSKLLFKKKCEHCLTEYAGNEMC